MFKKAIALTLALVMLIMPMTASAVTWNKVVTGLHSNGYYDDGTTTVVKEGDVTTVTGGEIDFSGIYDDQSFFGEHGVFVFDNVTSRCMFIRFTDEVSGDSKVIIKDTSNIEGISLVADGSNNVAIDNQSVIDYAACSVKGNSSVLLENNSEMNSISGNALDQASIKLVNNGTINKWMYANTESGNVDIINQGFADEASAWSSGGDVSLVNSGSATYVSVGADGGAATMVNSGSVDYMYANCDRGGEVTVENTGSAGEIGIYSYYIVKDGESYPTAEELQAFVQQSVHFVGEYNGADTYPVELTVVNEEFDPVDENGDVIEWEDSESIIIEIVVEEKQEQEPIPEPDPIELQRQAEGIGGVTTSPVWNWQGYLGHSSKPMWIYVNGEKTMMRQRLFWLGDSTKNHTCRINVTEPDPTSIELRVGLDMLRTAQRAEISVISILDADSNTIAQFAVSDLLGAFEQYGLVEGELLCVSADADAEVMKVTLSGEYLPLEAE